MSKSSRPSAQMAMILAWLDAGQISLALATLEQMVQTSPDLNACLLLGRLHMRTGSRQAAHNAFVTALSFDNACFEALHELGVIEGMEGQHEQALQRHRQALALRPNWPGLHYNLGCTLDKLGLHAEALQSFDACIRLAPHHPGVWYNRAQAIASLNRPGDEADMVTSYRKAIEIEPHLADAHLNLGHLLLEQMDFAEGWAEYGWRWKSPEFKTPALRSSLPAWTGQTRVASLLVWREQGIGDEILYGTMLADLRARADDIHVLTDGRLIPLLRRTHPDFHFHAARSEPHTPDVPSLTHQIPIGSLGQFLRPTREDFQRTQHPLLGTNPSRTTRLREELDRCTPATRVRCGLSWQSSTSQGVSKGFSLTDLLPVLALPGLGAVDLQYQDLAEVRSDMLRDHGIRVHRHEGLDHRQDIDGLASLIECCDVVVTCSTTTAHLAGAIGKTTLLLLPRRKGKFWYWHHTAGRSLWYPSVRVFEQSADGQWGDVVERVRNVLQSEFLT